MFHQLVSLAWRRSKTIRSSRTGIQIECESIRCCQHANFELRMENIHAKHAPWTGAENRWCRLFAIGEDVELLIATG